MSKFISSGISIGSVWILGLLLFLFVLLATSIAVWLLQGISLLKVSNKMGVKGAVRYFGFIPYANSWLLGALAQTDEESYPFEKKKSNWKLLCLLSKIVPLLVFFIAFLCILLSFIPFVGLLFTLLMIPVLLVDILAGYAGSAVTHLARFKVFRRLAGDDAPWMLVLSMISGIGRLIVWLILAYNKKYEFRQIQDFPEGDSYVQDFIK